MTTGTPAPGRSAGLDVLRGSGVALVTTYRRDGRGVGTPVGIRVAADRAYFTTRARTWKVRRLARDPRATVAPCTRRGRPTGEAVECVARRLDSDPFADGSPLRARLWELVYRLYYRDVPVYYELRPAAGSGGPAGDGNAG